MRWDELVCACLRLRLRLCPLCFCVSLAHMHACIRACGCACVAGAQGLRCCEGQHDGHAIPVLVRPCTESVLRPQVFEEETGRRIADVFERFDAEPIAAASLAQACVVLPVVWCLLHVACRMLHPPSRRRARLHRFRRTARSLCARRPLP